MNSGDWPLGFSLDNGQVLSLLADDRFYSSADTAIKEAILNFIDVCGRQEAGNCLFDELGGHGRIKVAGGQAVEIEHWHRFLHARRPAHVGRQDGAGELLPGMLIINPWRLYPQSTDAALDGALPAPTVTHYQSVAVFVPFAHMTADILILTLVEVEDGQTQSPRHVIRPLNQETEFGVTSVSYNLSEILSRSIDSGRMELS